MTGDGLILRFGEDEIEATCVFESVGSAQVQLGDSAPFEVRPISSGTYHVRRGGRSWLIKAAADGDRCWLFVNGAVLVVDVQKKESRSRQTGHTHSVMAPMPATVTKVLVAVGQQVKKGETLLILEAMKMELPILAPVEGTIQKINCKEREIVRPNVQLIEFDRKEAGLSTSGSRRV